MNLTATALFCNVNRPRIWALSQDNSVSLHELVLMDLRESGDGKALAKGVKSNTSATRWGKKMRCLRYYWITGSPSTMAFYR